jgi:WD40 repeat protein
MVYSPDGKWLGATYITYPTVGDREPIKVRLWNLVDLSKSIDVADDPVGFPDPRCSAGFDPHSRLFVWSNAPWASDEVPGQLVVCDTATSIVTKLRAANVPFPVTVLAQSNSEFRIAACGSVWTYRPTNPPQLVLATPGQCAADAYDPGTSVAFLARGGEDHTGGRLLAKDARIDLLRFPTGSKMTTWHVRRFGQTVHWTVLRLSPDGRWLAAGNCYGIYVIGVRSHRQVSHLAKDSEHFLTVDDLAFSPDGSRIVGVGGLVAVWTVPQR